METPVGNKHQVAAVRTVFSLKADASGNLPEKLQLVPSGVWPESWKGSLEITVTDLLEMKSNFDQGVGLPAKGAEGAPIDYSHEDWKKAAFWIREVEVENGILYATKIEWTPAGAQAVKDKEYKFFSPSFYPACLGMWQNPENPLEMARNVLVGGGLTNIPFFSGLSGLKASKSTIDNDAQGSMIYISADSKGDTMDLATARKMSPSDVANNEEAKKVLSENKGELTPAEQVAFGLNEAPTPTDTPVDNAPQDEPAPQPTEDQQQAADIQASIKSGKMVLVEASKYAALENRIDAMGKQLDEARKEKIEADVAKHVARGAIKADQVESWTKRIMADASAADLLDGLNGNPSLATESGKEGVEASAQEDERHKKAIAKVNAARKDGKQMSYSEAKREVINEEETE